MNINLSKFRFPGRKYALITIALFTVIGTLAIRLHADNESADHGYAAASDGGDYGSYGKKGKSYPAGTIRGEALDEAKGGRTLRGTPLIYRTEKCFPAEPRDLFWQMDMVVSASTGKLEPLNFDEDGDGEVGDKPNPEFNGRDPLGDPADRDGIRGRNTWLLWGGGNEAFWGWLQEQGYGLNDFLILMDSRQRANRFKTAGLRTRQSWDSISTREKARTGATLFCGRRSHAMKTAT